MIVNKRKRTCRIVGFTVPADYRIKLKDNEKRNKQIGFARELKNQWKIKVTVLPIVIVCFGTVTKVWYRCCILTFDPAKNAIPRWCTGRKGHILMAVMRGNRVGGNWLMKWDKLKKFPWYTHRLMHRKRVTLNCMTVISAWWRSNMQFQRSSRRLSGRWTII